MGNYPPPGRHGYRHPRSCSGPSNRAGLRFASMSRQATPSRTVVPNAIGPTRVRRTANLGPERRREAIRDPFGEGHLSSFRRPSKGDVAKVVYRALEFKPAGTWRGPENPFRTMGETSHEVEIGISVLFKRRQGHTLDFALGAVAREHPSHCDLIPPCARISRSTVARTGKNAAKVGKKSDARVATRGADAPRAGAPA